MSKMTEEIKTKKCARCGDIKPLEEFTTCSKSPDGKGSYCKVCQKAYTKQWVADHPEQARQNRRDYDASHPEKVKKQRKDYRDSHKEYFSKKQKEHVAENPEKYMMYEARKRARKFGLECTITPKDIVVPEFCPILGLKLERGKVDKNRDNTPSLDRIVPEIGYIPSNIAVMSYRANRIKNNGTAEEHRLIADWMDAQKELTNALRS
jgi:hypothetical protein